MAEPGFDAYLAVLKGLPGCVSKDSVEELFEANGVKDYVARRKLLFEAMGFIDAFNAPTPSPISPEQQYTTELDIFVEGSWRLLI